MTSRGRGEPGPRGLISEPSEMNRYVLALVAGLCLWTVQAARGVINLETTLEKTWAAADPVVTGIVGAVDAERRLLELEKVEACKGTAPATVRIQIQQPAELLSAVRRGQPAVVFVNPRRPMAVIHLADTWLLASRVGEAQAGAWRVVQEHDLKRTFPGRTQTLVRLLGELKAGKSPLLNAMDDAVFKGEFRPLGSIAAEAPAAMAAADFDGDGRTDLAVIGGGRVRVHFLRDGRYADGGDAWEMRCAAGPLAVGDCNGDGRADLLAGTTLGINTGRGWRMEAVERLEAGIEALAGTIADVDGDGRAEVLVLTRDGRLFVLRSAGEGARWACAQTVRLWKDAAPAVHAAFGDYGDDGRLHAMVLHENGPVCYALEEGRAPADFARLTGERLSAYDREGRGFRGALAAGADVTGDGRADYLIIAEKFSLLLLNRGGGAFFASAQGAQHLCPAEAPPGAPALVGGTILARTRGADGRRDHLLALLKDGRLLELTNPEPKARTH